MNARKVRARSVSEQKATNVILKSQQKLIGELHELLSNWGPNWYTDEIDSRLTKMLALSSRTRSRAPSQKLPQSNLFVIRDGQNGTER